MHVFNPKGTMNDTEWRIAGISGEDAETIFGTESDKVLTHILKTFWQTHQQPLHLTATLS